MFADSGATLLVCLVMFLSCNDSGIFYNEQIFPPISIQQTSNYISTAATRNTLKTELQAM